ncbi:ribonuclease P protein component, partial [Holdemanella sp.]
MITLKNSREFGSVYSTKNSVANKYLVMYLRSNGLDYNRLGISVS